MILAVHERILREALGDIVTPRALRVVIRANRRSDLHQIAAERHFDNAPDPRTLCELWQRGLSAWLARTVVLCGPCDSTARRLLDRHRALVAFGYATHALADFYAHTNWIELAVARGESPQPAPLLGPSCDPESFPPDLQSGYFHLRHGLSGCPRTGPPPGFTYCHAQLNKDAPNRGHGAEHPAPGGPTYHDHAVQLAVASNALRLGDALRPHPRCVWGWRPAGAYHRAIGWRVSTTAGILLNWGLNTWQPSPASVHDSFAVPRSHPLSHLCGKATGGTGLGLFLTSSARTRESETSSLTASVWCPTLPVYSPRTPAPGR